MVGKVFNTGNGLVVSLPEPVIALLELQEGSEVDVAVDLDAQQIRLSPVGPHTADIDAEFARQLDAFIAHYRPALVALAR